MHPALVQHFNVSSGNTLGVACATCVFIFGAVLSFCMRKEIDDDTDMVHWTETLISHFHKSQELLQKSGECLAMFSIVLFSCI